MKDQSNQKIKTYYFLLTLLHIYMFNYSRKTFPNMTFYGMARFLTHISFYVNGFYFITKFLTHIPILNALFTPIHEKCGKKIFRFGFSLSFVVASMYWGMRLADPKLLLPSGLVIPIDLDIFLHGGNFILNFLEHIFIQPEHNYQNSNKIFLMFLIIYSIFLKVAYHAFGIFSYPFVKEKSPFVYLIVVVFGMLFLMSGDLIFRGICKLNEGRSKIKQRIN